MTPNEMKELCGLVESISRKIVECYEIHTDESWKRKWEFHTCENTVSQGGEWAIVEASKEIASLIRAQEAEIARLREQRDTAVGALGEIITKTSDVDERFDKVGDSWIAASCRKFAREALVNISGGE